MRFYLVKEKERLRKLFEFIQIISGRSATGIDFTTSGYHCKSAVLSVTRQSCPNMACTQLGAKPLLEYILFSY